MDNPYYFLCQNIFTREFNHTTELQGLSGSVNIPITLMQLLKFIIHLLAHSEVCASNIYWLYFIEAISMSKCTIAYSLKFAIFYILKKNRAPKINIGFEFYFLGVEKLRSL